MDPACASPYVPVSREVFLVQPVRASAERGPASGSVPRARARASDSDPSEVTKLLRRVRLFDAFDDTQLMRLASSSRVLATKKEQLVFSRGERSEALYVVKRGRFKAFAKDRAGHRVTLNVIGPSEVFGEIALTDRNARSADVISLSTGSLLVIEREAVMSLADASPALGWALARIVSRRLRRLTERLEDRAFLDLEARLAKRLVEAAEDVSGNADAPLLPGLCVALTQRDLAELVDGSRERVNRRLAAWTSEGLIAVDRARITIRDPEKLRHVYEHAAPKAVR